MATSCSRVSRASTVFSVETLGVRGCDGVCLYASVSPEMRGMFLTTQWVFSACASSQREQALDFFGLIGEKRKDSAEYSKHLIEKLSLLFVPSASLCLGFGFLFYTYIVMCGLNFKTFNVLFLQF